MLLQGTQLRQVGNTCPVVPGHVTGMIHQLAIYPNSKQNIDQVKNI